MPTDIEKPLPIFKLQVTELNITSMAGLLQGLAKISLLSADGAALGDLSYSEWSTDTWDKVADLCKSIEKDLENTFKSDRFTQWEDDTSEQAIEYNSQGDWK